MRWFVGNAGRIVRKTGAGDFEALPAITAEPLWGTGPDDAYAVGAKGVILHWDGSAWTQQASGTGQDLISLFGVDGDLTIVGGRGNGVLARQTDAGWHTQILAGNPGFNGIWMAPDGTAWIAGNRGSLLSVAPGSFDATRHRSGTPEVLHGMWVPPRWPPHRRGRGSQRGRSKRGFGGSRWGVVRLELSGRWGLRGDQGLLGVFDVAMGSLSSVNAVLGPSQGALLLE